MQFSFWHSSWRNRDVQPGRSWGSFVKAMEWQGFANRSCSSSKTFLMFMPHWTMFASNFYVRRKILHDSSRKKSVCVPELNIWGHTWVSLLLCLFQAGTRLSSLTDATQLTPKGKHMPNTINVKYQKTATFKFLLEKDLKVEVKGMPK